MCVCLPACLPACLLASLPSSSLIPLYAHSFALSLPSLKHTHVRTLTHTHTHAHTHKHTHTHVHVLNHPLQDVWRSTAIAGNDLLASVLYTTGICATACGECLTPHRASLCSWHPLKPPLIGPLCLLYEKFVMILASFAFFYFFPFLHSFSNAAFLFHFFFYSFFILSSYFSYPFNTSI